MLKTVADYLVLGVDAATILVIAIGATKALYTMLASSLQRQITPGVWRKIRGDFGTWLLLGLEFALASDIVLTAVSPNWNEIGKLGAIAGIRTFLGYFLEKDMEKQAEMADGVTSVRQAA